MEGWARGRLTRGAGTRRGNCTDAREHGSVGENRSIRVAMCRGKRKVKGGKNDSRCPGE